MEKAKNWFRARLNKELEANQQDVHSRGRKQASHDEADSEEEEIEQDGLITDRAYEKDVVIPAFGIAGLPGVGMTSKRSRFGVYFVAVAATIFLAWAQFSVAWVVLIWALHDGPDLFLSLKQEMSNIFGFPYTEDVDPAFLLNPESETVPWINVFIRKIWTDSLRPWHAKDVKTMINAKMMEHFEGHSPFVQLLCPQILQFDIGQETPWVTGVKTYSNQQQCEADSLTMDVGIMLHLYPRIVVGTLRNFLLTGIHELKWSANVRLTLSPLLRDTKLFGQTQISLIGKPSIDYTISGFLGFLDLPIVKPCVKILIYELFNFIVYPRKVRIPTPGVYNFNKHLLLPSTPCGILRVNMKEGKNLSGADVPTICSNMRSSSDPYCVIRLGKRSIQTPVIKANLNPVWNFMCEFPMSSEDIEHKELVIKVMDYDYGINPDDDLGFTTINIKNVCTKKKEDAWYKLGDGDEGYLHIIMQYVPVLIERPKLRIVPSDPNVSEAILAMLIYQAEMSRKCRPMVVLQVSGHPPVTTSFGYLSQNWEFAEEFFLPVHNVDTDKITIKLVDYNARAHMKNPATRIIKNIATMVTESVERDKAIAYHESKHEVLGIKTVSVEAFTGFKQKIILDSEEGGSIVITLMGKVFFIANALEEAMVGMGGGEDDEEVFEERRSDGKVDSSASRGDSSIPSSPTQLDDRLKNQTSSSSAGSGSGSGEGSVGHGIPLNSISSSKDSYGPKTMGNSDPLTAEMMTRPDSSAGKEGGSRGSKKNVSFA